MLRLPALGATAVVAAPRSSVGRLAVRSAAGACGHHAKPTPCGRRSCAGFSGGALLPTAATFTSGRSTAATAFAAAAAAAAAAALIGMKSGGRDAAAAHCEGRRGGPVLVIGSLNADIIVEINRFPKRGETLNTRSPDTGVMVPGGKGANQAVAMARLSEGTGRKAQFVCQFGNDSHAKTLEGVLLDNGLDIAACGRSDKPSGQAFIFLEADGQNSILIVGGSNLAWPQVMGAELTGLVRGASAVLLQREIPEHVNEAVAELAHGAGVPVVQDVGGEERPFSDKILRRLSYICPNETELERLSGLPTGTEEQIVVAARQLQKKGVKNVLVTLGSQGSLLLDESGKVTKQGIFAVPGGKVVDTTGAGDCFRAAFTVALVEGRPLQECMKFAAAAGSIAVSRMGAIPSIPSREECRRLIEKGGL